MNPRRCRLRFGHLAAFLSVPCLVLGLGYGEAVGDATSRVSVSSGGAEGDAESSRASVSADGRYVAFYSDADTLVPGDMGLRDVFVRDRQTGVTIRVSVDSAGLPGNDKSDRPSISGTGRFVAFASDADNLVPNDLNGVRDIFVHDRDVDQDGMYDEAGAIATSRVSASSSGLESNGRSNMPAISSDGRYVVFRSRATNLAAGAIGGLDQIFVHDRKTGATSLMSVGFAGPEGNANSDRPAISPDGRFVAFHSDADNIVSGDDQTYDPNNCPACIGAQDAFVRDRDPDANGVMDEGNGTTERASVSSGGVAGNGPSSRPKLSADGRFVLFKSSANNLVPGDTNNADDVFVRDRLNNTTVRVSVSAQGAETAGFGPVSQRASISHDGRFVAFISEADDLVPNDTNLSKDIFVRDRQTGTTVRVSVDSNGLQGNADSNRPSISGDGRFVAFYSDAFNLVPGDEPPFDAVLCPACAGVRDVFVHDRDSDTDGIFDEPGAVTTTRVSVSSGGVPANVDCTRPSISGDGRYVAFRSTADNLVAGDFNGLQDVFVHDRQTGTTVRVSVSSSGTETTDGNSDLPSISGDGRYVAFWSKAGNLVPGDDPPYDPVLCPACVGVADIFVRDRDPDTNGIFDEANATTTRVSVSTGGIAADADSDRPWMAVGGRYVGFISEATNLVPGDNNGHTDVFVHDLSTASTSRVSISTGGIEGNFGSDRVTLSADGRFVAFRSKADNLVPGDDLSFDADSCPSCTGVRDVFLQDRDVDVNGVLDEPGQIATTRISVSTAGDPGDRDTGGPKMSGDGTVVAMVGTTTNLVAGDTNYSDDVFARILATAVTERVSVGSAGAQASTPILAPPDSDDTTMSGDGRFVAFRSYGVNLVSRDTNIVADIFLHDRDVDGDGVFDEMGAIETSRISVSSGGAESDLASGGAKISSDGMVVAFYSDATNLVAADLNLVRDVFVHTAGDCLSGEECDDGNPCTDDTCNGGICQNGPIPNCIPCPNGATDCSDGIACTSDICVGGVCQFPANCADDGEPCNGDEFCDVGGTGQCEHTGDPCPGICVPGQGCPCGAPLVESAGSRYIAITPQPEDGPTPTAFVVTSPDWPCMTKYVGAFLRCGGSGPACTGDADCNACTVLSSPCLTNDDCRTCQGSTDPCQSSADCGGLPCESVQVCQLSGLTCDSSGSLEEFDIDQDGIPDGVIATLVDDPADRAIMTADEWGTTTYFRCSQSQEPCVVDADCDVGQCAVSGRGCSIAANDCRHLCAIGGTECSFDVECSTPGDTCSAVQPCSPFETCQPGKIYVLSADLHPSDVNKATQEFFPSTYTVRAECGAMSVPVDVQMRLWADTDDNGLVNISDALFIIKAFQGTYLPAIPSRTVAAFDLQGNACTPNQIVNINDVFSAILAFKGVRFNPDVLDSFDNCGVPCP